MTDLTFDIDSARDDLGTGYGSGSTIAALSRGLFRSRLILLRLLITEAAQRHRDAAADAGLDAAYGALADLQAGHPETVRALVLYPHTGAWLNHALRRVTGAGDADSPVPMWADLCYLGWLAASGAVTAGGSGSMTLVMRNGEVMLPRFGLAKLDADERCGYSELTWNDRGELAFRGDHGELVVESPAVEDNAQWLPLRRLRSGAADSEPVNHDDLVPC
ncbi:MAG: hypothetical protein HOQ24_08590, partial [Mycobacteriaceae bacterium]|nr:hypothetical protein [Mycobacteriaceae bacterium]